MSDKRGNKNKALVEALLKQSGKSYEEWLEEKHSEFSTENADELLAAVTKAVGRSLWRPGARTQ